MKKVVLALLLINLFFSCEFKNNDEAAIKAENRDCSFSSKSISRVDDIFITSIEVFGIPINSPINEIITKISNPDSIKKIFDNTIMIHPKYFYYYNNSYIIVEQEELTGFLIRDNSLVLTNPSLQIGDKYVKLKNELKLSSSVDNINEFYQINIGGSDFYLTIRVENSIIKELATFEPI